MKIPNNVTEWLLEEENPSIRYRTMRELQKLPESDPNLQLAKEQISFYQPVKKMFDAMHPEGYWEVFSPSTKKSYGKGVDYRQDSTHYILGYLAELGMTRDDPGLYRPKSSNYDLKKTGISFDDYFQVVKERKINQSKNKT